MVTTPADDEIENALLKSRMVTSEQIQTAKEEQARLSGHGQKFPLADVLVRLHVITDAIRDNVIQAAQNPDCDGIDRIGPFKIVKKLGEGGMGAVYLAEDTENHRTVALKVLPEKYSKQKECLSRFRREAKAATHLRHKNIAVALADGEDKGVHYYAMEYCEGESLDELRKHELQLPLERSIDIVTQVAQGLQFAHEQGIVHRDIKPANIFVGDSGVVKILDMGLSKDLGDEEQSFNTQSGAVLGTAHYISPEQAKGEKTIDGRTDIYSLGATFYNLITGKTPFSGATPALIMMKHLTEQLPNPQDLVENIPDGVVQVIRKMMAKAPEDRYRNCAELIRDLESLKAGKPPEFAALDDTKSSVLPRRMLGLFAAAASTAKPVSAADEITRTSAARAKAPGKSHLPMIAGAAIAVLTVAVVGWRALRGNAVLGIDNEIGSPAEKPAALTTEKPVAQIEKTKPRLVAEDFETVDLDKRRDDWRIITHTAFSIVAEPGHGKVLRLDTAGKPQRMPQLDIPLKTADVLHRALEGTIKARSSAGGPNSSTRSGVSVTFYWVEPGNTIFRAKSAEIETASREWATYRFKQKALADAKEVFVRIEATADVGVVFIDDLEVDFATGDAAETVSDPPAPIAPQRTENAPNSNPPKKESGGGLFDKFKKLF